MLPRLWIALLALLLLLAAPAGGALAAPGDTAPAPGLCGDPCDDAALAPATPPLVARPSARHAHAGPRANVSPPDPLRDPIFRPPRAPDLRP